MNIVLIGGQKIPNIGGIESYVYNLSKELVKIGHHVTIICSNRKSFVSVDSNNLQIVNIKTPESNILGMPALFFLSLGYILRNSRKIDVVHFQSVLFAFLPGWIANLLGCKVCYTIHSLPEDNPRYSKRVRKVMYLVSKISTKLCGRCILTVSKSKACEIEKRYKSKSFVVTCGVNRIREIKDNTILKQYDLEPENYYLTIGRITPIKNLDILINAFILSKSSRKLVIAGDFNNDYGYYLIRLAGKNKKIVFTGGVAGDNKECLLSNCFVNSLLSSSEGMPISLLEAMSYAKPSIVSDIPANRELLGDDLGYWCKVNSVDDVVSQIRYIEKHYNEALSQGLQMKEIVNNHYLWPRVAVKYISMLKEIFNVTEL